MKTPKLIHLTVLLVVAVAPFLLTAPTEALAANGHSFQLTGPTSYYGQFGDYSIALIILELCDGSIEDHIVNSSPFSGNAQNTIKEYAVVFIKESNGTVTHVEWIYGCSGICGCTAKSTKVSYCSNFSIPKRVPRSPAIPVSFKGPGNITSANITFKDLGYSLSIWLHHYDWGSGIWYGYLNTTYLPLGKHHGHVTTFVDGVRGRGCATGGFKVVDE